MALLIRTDQMEALEQSDLLFTEWYVENIMKNWFAHLYFSLTGDGKREMVRNARRRAQAHGLRSAEAQAHFIGLMWAIGPNFFLFPGFSDVLAHRDLPEMARIDLLFSDAVTPTQAAAAIAGADDRYWYIDGGVED